MLFFMSIIHYSCQIFKKIRPVVVELFVTDRRTDMSKLIEAFRYFAKAPEKLRMNALYVVFMHMCISNLLYELTIY